MQLVNDASAQHFSGASTTSLTTSGIPNTAGNLLVVVFRVGSGDTDGVITDSAGNTYTQIGMIGSPHNLGFQVWACICLSSTSNAVTVTYSSRPFTAVTLMQFSGAGLGAVASATFASQYVVSGASVSCVPDSTFARQIVIAASDVGNSRSNTTIAPGATFSHVYGSSADGHPTGHGSHDVWYNINSVRTFNGGVTVTATYDNEAGNFADEKTICVAIFSPSNTVFDATFNDAESTVPLTWIEHYKEDPTNSVPASENKAYAEVDLNDPEDYYLGYKAPLVVQWSRVTRGLSDKNGQVEHLNFGATFSDTSRVFRGYLDDVTSPAAGTRFLPNRPLVERMISDEDRRAKNTPKVIANGFVSDYAPLGGLTFSFSGSDWMKKSFSRSRKTQLKWQPLVRVEDFDPNTTPPDVLNRPAPVIYGRLSDMDEQTVADSVRSTGYLPKPVSLSATVHGSPANPISRRYYFTGLNGFYGNPNIQQWSDHRGETDAAYIDVSNAPDDAELRAQAQSGTASTWVEITGSCPDAAAVRVYHGDVSGSNIQGLGLADSGGSPASFTFLDGKSPTSGGATFAEGFDATPPLRNNTYIPGTLSGGNVTTDTGSGAFAPIYTGIRLCDDSIYRSEFLVNASASKSILSLYLGGVRIPDSELSDYYLVPNSTEWNAVWPNPFYVAFNGRRYTTIYVDRAYAKDHGLVSSNELSQGNTLFTVNVEGIETVGDGTGDLITSIVLQAQHFAENPGDRPWNAQGWVDASPFTFTAIPTLPYVDRTSFADVDALVNLEGATVFGFQGEQVSTTEGLARFCTSGDFDIGFSRQGQLMASREPDTVPSDLQVVTDVTNLNQDSLNIKDDVTGQFFNVMPYRWGRDYSGRTSGGSIVSKGLHIVLADSGGWQSVASSEFEVRDTSSIVNYDQEMEAQQLDLHCIRDSASAAIIMARRLNRYKNPLRTVSLTVPLSGLDIELGNVFLLTALDGMTASGWTERALRCTRHEVDPNSCTVTVTAYDLQRVLDAA